MVPVPFSVRVFVMAMLSEKDVSAISVTVAPSGAAAIASGREE